VVILDWNRYLQCIFLWHYSESKESMQLAHKYKTEVKSRYLSTAVNHINRLVFKITYTFKKSRVILCSKFSVYLEKVWVNPHPFLPVYYCKLLFIIPYSSRDPYIHAHHKMNMYALIRHIIYKQKACKESNLANSTELKFLFDYLWIHLSYLILC